jgi:hypothetical protein
VIERSSAYSRSIAAASSLALAMVAIVVLRPGRGRHRYRPGPGFCANRLPARRAGRRHASRYAPEVTRYAQGMTVGGR